MTESVIYLYTPKGVHRVVTKPGEIIEIHVIGKDVQVRRSAANTAVLGLTTPAHSRP